MADDVTMGEVVRRLDSITAQLATIIAGQAEDRRHNTETFVRKDVMDSKFESIGQRFTEVEKDVEDGKKALANQQDRNRQLVFAIIGVAVPALISIILALVGAQGGVG